MNAVSVYNLLPCPVKSLTGYDCPGCGMQRAVVALFKGNLTESIYQYPALLPIVAMIIFLIIHLKFDIRYGHIILKIFFIINVVIIIISYFCKIINLDLL